MLQLSVFGYKRRAIRGNQKLAVDSGINIYINCLICYAMAGALVAVSGVFDNMNQEKLEYNKRKRERKKIALQHRREMKEMQTQVNRNHITTGS